MGNSLINWLKSLFWKQEMELTLVGLQNSGKSTLVHTISVRLFYLGDGRVRHVHKRVGTKSTLENHKLTSKRPVAIYHDTQTGGAAEDMTPTVGFNMKKVTRGNVTIKLWDIGGQPKFRSMWERYCRGVNAVVFVVDASDQAKFPEAKEELHQLMAKPQLANIPLLVLGNKNDLPEAVTDEDTLKQMLELDSIQGREVCLYSISAKNNVKIDVTLNWLIQHADQQQE